MAKLKMPGAATPPISPDPIATTGEQKGPLGPADLSGDGNITSGEDQALKTAIKAAKNFQCYYQGQFLSFKEGQEIENDQLIEFLLKSGAPLDVEAVE